jgi:hypothetical protein
MEMDWIDLLQKAIIAALAAYTTINARKEWKVRKRLGSNPTRCEDMARRMKGVEDAVTLINDDIKYILKRME